MGFYPAPSQNVKEDFVDPKRYADDDRCLKSDPPVPRSVVYREFRSPQELETVKLR